MLPWHEDAAMLPFIERLKCETDLTILLQAHNEAMQQLGPHKITRKLGEYAHVLDYVLFDASHGKGVRMDPSALQPYLDAAYASDELANTGIGVAGGLSERVVKEELPILAQSYPDLSWDAEGQLHPVDDAGARPLNILMAKDYLSASAGVLRSV
jgi:phosphoribosylanthranilate isomerase